MGNICKITLNHNNKEVFRMVIDRHADNTFSISEKDIDNFASLAKFYGNSIETKLKEHFNLKETTTLKQLTTQQIERLFNILLNNLNIDIYNINRNIFDKINIFYSDDFKSISSFRNNIILSENIINDENELELDVFFYEILTAYTNNGTVEEKIDILDKLINKDHEFYKPIRDIIIQKDLENNLYIKEIYKNSQKFKILLKQAQDKYNNFYDIFYNPKQDYDYEVKIGDIITFNKFKGFLKESFTGIFLENYNGFYIMLDLNNPDEIIVCEKDDIESIQYKAINFDYEINKQIYKKGSLKREYNKLIKDLNIKEEAEKYKKSGILFESSILYDGKNYYKVTNVIITNNYSIYLLQNDNGDIIRLNINDNNLQDLDQYSVIFDKSILKVNYSKNISDRKILTFNIVPVEIRTLEYNQLYDKIYSMIKNGDYIYVNDKKYFVNKVINNGFIQVYNESDETLQLIKSSSITKIETYNLLIDRDLENLFHPLTFSYNIEGKTLNPVMYSNLALRKGYKVIIPTKETKSGSIEKDFSKIQFKNGDEYVYDTMQYQEYDIEINSYSINGLNVGDIISSTTNDGKRVFYKIISKLKNDSFLIKQIKTIGDENKGYEYIYMSSENTKQLNIDKLYTYNKKTISNFSKDLLLDDLDPDADLAYYAQMLETVFGIPVELYNNEKGDNAYTDGKKIYLNIAKPDYLKHGTHEFIHIILGLIRYNDMELYYKIINNFSGNNFEEKEEQFVKQCINKFDNETIKNPDDYFNDVLNIIKDLINSKKGIDDISKINLETFLDNYFSDKSYNFINDLNSISDSIGYITALDKIKMVNC